MDWLFWVIHGGEVGSLTAQGSILPIVHVNRLVGGTALYFNRCLKSSLI